MTPQPDPSQPAPPPGGREPIFNLPPATKWLTLAILAVFALQVILPGRSGDWLVFTLAFESFSFWPQGRGLPDLGALPSLVTYALLHADATHLLLNLGFFLAFGSFVERRVGFLPFLLLVALTAAAGALAEFALRGGREILLIGASGVVYGMTGAAARFMLLDRGGLRRRAGLSLVFVLIGLNLAFGVIGLGDFLAGAQIGWKAHIGGFLAGLLAAGLLGKRPDPR
ncbi:rhomboid family intramembrane serine protease [Pelagibius sp.]|uniref:rhomboid family intramembrane serine protease n=1 Tax=Pelagibius sp. TaxID=1931238 RepID=UPI003B513392